MRWLLHVGDILDVTADTLICSANVDLNLSGGVGGAFNLRYGPTMQEALHRYLTELGRRTVSRGTIVVVTPCGSPYKAVVHAVAVDAGYTTSVEVVAALLNDGLQAAADNKAKSVAVTALGTGYGRLSMPDFAAALRQVVGRKYAPLECAILGLRSRHEAEELSAAVPTLELYSEDRLPKHR